MNLNIIEYLYNCNIITKNYPYYLKTLKSYLYDFFNLLNIKILKFMKLLYQSGPFRVLIC